MSLAEFVSPQCSAMTDHWVKFSTACKALRILNAEAGAVPARSIAPAIKIEIDRNTGFPLQSFNTFECLRSG
jgi:hypothetical protein